MTNGSCVHKLFFKNGRRSNQVVVESSESTETRVDECVGSNLLTCGIFHHTHLKFSF